ncbi:signal recognition particle-docking protein FtsY [Quadrisphaera sp. DSM 44207]|uniref:signal recognition particle-docking protein FtsY n=1 Tax=Quadrisphaera sp. DSM 44207 TaxID=1881057 RepID=UPI0008889B56|nr:signal recognition particle-docking protein FtsY [Quadrisphaera sp. DSM 44207]SDQ75739.1 signal recognition particle-docking protein FtsY [Quadrisphaera sp. DSM 44207]
MELLDPVVGYVALLAIGAIGTVTGLLSRGRLGRSAPRTPPPAPPTTRAPGHLPGVGDDAEDPRDTPTRTVATLPAPDALAEPPVEVAPARTVEVPAPATGRLVRLRDRLSRSNTALGRNLFQLLSRDTVDEGTWEEVEDTLIMADLGVGPATEIVERLRTRVAVLGERSPERVRELLREELLTAVDPSTDRSLRTSRSATRPAVVLVVGVNGTGKTTTVGKLARVLVAEQRDVVLAAADTFRAAAADQLATWGERVGVPTVRSDRDGADPASVAFDAVRAGTELEADVVLVDTAGRLQNKAGLMDELGKIKRVLERSGPVDEVLLVLDATTGQNGLRQAAVFAEVVQVTGIVLTKLDGTAKGGIVVAVQRELGVPVKLVGLGEGPDDLAPFDPEAFVDALVG